MHLLFELGIIDDRSGAFVPLRALPEEHVSLEDSTFRLHVCGSSYVGEAWSLGPLARLVPQLAYVRRRLEADQVALLRSGVESQLDVPYFLFEPSPSSITVSCFLIPDRALGWSYPSNPDGSDSVDAAALYEYVHANRQALLTAASPDTFRELVTPREDLLLSIAAELVRAARRL